MFFLFPEKKEQNKNIHTNVIEQKQKQQRADIQFGETHGEKNTHSHAYEENDDDTRSVGKNMHVFALRVFDKYYIISIFCTAW